MPRQKRILLTTLIGSVALLGVGFATVIYFVLSSPLADSHVYEPAEFKTAADAAKLCPIPLPPQATHIHYARWSQFQAFEEYLRFDAPVAVCIQHAAVIAPGQPLAPIAPDPPGPPSMQQRPGPGVFHDISWFDLKAAVNAVGAGGGSNRPQVWVDQQHGVFYYRLRD